MKRAAEWLLVLAMGGMVAMVFGNVVLRYLFDGGITVSEELSRFLFVWMTFLGAVVVMAERGHLGFEAVVQALPPGGRRLCRIASAAMVLGCCGVFLVGAWPQVLMNLSNQAPVSGVPLGWGYAAALVAGVGMAVLAGRDLRDALLGRAPPARDGAAGEPGA